MYGGDTEAWIISGDTISYTNPVSDYPFTVNTELGEIINCSIKGQVKYNKSATWGGIVLRSNGAGTHYHIDLNISRIGARGGSFGYISSPLIQDVWYDFEIILKDFHMWIYIDNELLWEE
jgi:hypothetical protein